MAPEIDKCIGESSDAGSRVCTDDRYRDSKLLKDSVMEQEYVLAS
jgi:hypothetical protein